MFLISLFALFERMIQHNRHKYLPLVVAASFTRSDNPHEGKEWQLQGKEIIVIPP